METRQATRGLILRALKTSGGITVLGLADQVEVSPVTIRHHLSSLQADGLVEATVERRSVGRPHHVFQLTDAGEEVFPHQYLSLAKRLLEQIKNTLAPQTTSQLFKDVAQAIIDEHQDQFENKSTEQRMNVLAKILEAEGFMVNWEKQGDEYHIIEHNCPYRNLVQEFPELCQLDHTLISNIMDAPAEKVGCQTEGDPSCTFVIKVTDLETGANSK